MQESEMHVTLRLEGMMVLTFGEENKFLEAAIHSQAHDHHLEVIIEKCINAGTGEPCRVITRRDYDHEFLREYSFGNIYVDTGAGWHPQTSAGVSEATADDAQPEGTPLDEQWTTLLRLPTMERHLYQKEVTLDYQVLRPRLWLGNGKFYAVIPLADSVEGPVDYAVEQKRLKDLAKKSSAERRIGSINDLVAKLDQDGQPDAVKILGRLAPAVGTKLTLQAGQQLVAELRNPDNDAESPKNLFGPLMFDPQVEYIVTIRNFPGSAIATTVVTPDHDHVVVETTSGNSEHQSDSFFFNLEHHFHSVLFDAAIMTEVPTKFLLATEEMLERFLDGLPRFPIKTGGSNPKCPIVGRRQSRVKAEDWPFLDRVKSG